MKQLSISTPKNTDPILAELPADEKILAAFNSKKIIDCTDKEIDFVVGPAINEAFKFIGKKIDADTNNNLVIIYQCLPGELRKFLPSMKIKEFPIAVKRGIYQEFGDYFGINVAELIRFCKLHFESDQRAAAAKVFLKPVESHVVAPTPEQQFYLFKNNCLLAFEKFQNDKSFETMGPSCYDFLNKIKLIIFSTKEKYDILEKAARLIVSEQNIKLSVIVEDFARRPHKRIISAIENSLEKDEPVPGDIKELIILKSKYLTLKAFFHDIIDSDLNISELIDNKKNVFLSL